MPKSYIIVYLLNGIKYEGDIYVLTDTNKSGYSCYADPYYRFELDVQRIFIDNSVKESKKNTIIDSLFCYT